MINSETTISKRQNRQELFTVLFFALFILFVRKIPWVAHALGALPVLGASIPFFLLSTSLLMWSLRKGRSLADFGLHIPQSFFLTIVWGVGAGLFRLLTSFILSPVLTQLTGSAPVLTRIDPLQGNLLLLLILTPLMWLTIGFGEEVLHRGFIMTRLAQIWGGTRRSWILALFVHAVIFSVGHAYQGLAGVILTGISALIYGSVYMLSGRNLWTAIIAHSLANSVAFVERFLTSL